MKQLDLLQPEPAPAIPHVRENDPNVEFLCRLIEGRDWITSALILEEMERPVTESNKRWLRALADASGGRVAGGQKGYKLTRQMTRAEYDHWRNWMNHQADEMKRRVLAADHVWFARVPVEAMP